MSKLAKQFSELRQNTPKRVQWLLMAAAFVVVLILLILLFSDGNKSNTKDETDACFPASCSSFKSFAESDII